LMHSAPYLAGIGLLGAGFLLSLVSLRSLPLFVVEVARASSLGVTALLARPLLGTRLQRGEPLSLAAIGVGLVLLAGSAAAGPPVHSGPGMRIGLGAALAVLVAAAVTASRWAAGRARVLLGVLAGSAFGLVAVAQRVLASATSVPAVAVDPATYVMLAAGVLGLLLYATALQRVSVTAATAAMVGIETLAASLVGLVWLGDHPRSGWSLVAAAGFVVALGGALAVVRYGDPAGAGARMVG
jgi:drug/metabolite transporter (DMT)-like permease